MIHKYIFTFFLVTCYFLLGKDPSSDTNENLDSLNLDNIELDSIELNVYSEIYLHSNELNLHSVLMMNRTEKDIYVFWNSFLFQNLFSENQINRKKTAFMNEILMFRKGNPVMTNYIDSSSNSIPVFIKLPKYSEYKRRPQNKGQTIVLFFKDLNKYISLKDRKSVELKIIVNYIDSDDVKIIKDKFGIDISERAIFPSDTRISTFSRVDDTSGYIECFNSPETDIDLSEFNEILKSKIKKLTVYVYPDIFEIDPSRK